MQETLNDSICKELQKFKAYAIKPFGNMIHVALRKPNQKACKI